MFSVQLPVGEVTPEQVESDPRFSDILNEGHGVPSSDSNLGSVAIAVCINWWRCCMAGSTAGTTVREYLSDVDALTSILEKFKEAVDKDPTLVLENAKP